MIAEWISAILMVLGAIFILLSALGVLRFPDLYSRMHAATKASSFGVALMLIGISIWIPTPYIIIEALLIILFIYITAPIASHMIGRVAHLLNIKVGSEDCIDELEQAIICNSEEKEPETGVDQ